MLDSAPGNVDFAAPLLDRNGNRVGRRGFRSEGTDIRDLGDLPGGPAEAVAHGSNRKGQIVGQSMVEGGGHAMLWEAGPGMIDLGDLPGGEVSSVARAINEAGQVVGRANSEDGDRAFLWDAGRGMRDLNDLVDTPEGVVLRDATAIDEAGRIIGLATTGPEGAAKTVPFVWDPEAPRLDILGGPDTTGTPEPGAELPVAWDEAVEDLKPGEQLYLVRAMGLVTDGPVVGRAVDGAGRSRPALWLPDAGILDLRASGGDLAGREGTAHAVNSAGQVVGQVLGADGRSHAFLWDADRGMVDLDDLLRDADEVTLLAAVDIIGDGRILAWGIENDVVYFYRLTPTGPAARRPAAEEEATLRDGLARIIPAALGDEEPEGQGGYTLTAIGQLVLGTDPAPVLSMDESGRVVGGCDLLALDCPYLWSNLGQVTNFVPQVTPQGDLSGGPFGGTISDSFSGSGNGNFANGATPAFASGTSGPTSGGSTSGGSPSGNGANRSGGVPTLPDDLFSGLLPGSSTSGAADGASPPGAGGSAVVPLPPAGAALALGLLCLFGLRRRGRPAIA